MTKQRKVWHRVKAPTVWRPKEGEELVGEYIGTELKAGQYGEYRTHVIRTDAGIFRVSGAMTDDLFGLLEVSKRVKLVYCGKKRSSKDSDREYKVYELYTEEAVQFTMVG